MAVNLTRTSTGRMKYTPCSAASYMSSSRVGSPTQRDATLSVSVRPLTESTEPFNCARPRSSTRKPAPPSPASSGKMILGACTSTMMSMRSPINATAAAAAMSIPVRAVMMPCAPHSAALRM